MASDLYIKPNMFAYRAAQLAAFAVAKVVFCRKFVRNELKHAEPPYVVVANHQCALDFVNLIGATRKPLTFVLSNSFFNSLPVNGLLKKLAVIPKQQFQTAVSDMKKMKAVVDSGHSLVIYPAGLMCEDGVSTPIPDATYKFLKWMDADIYAARCTGTYFVMPKWTKGMRRGRTRLDIYKLIEKAELQRMKVSQVREKVEKALLFNAYEEQETELVPYKDCDDIRGLENVLYQCPECGKEFSMEVPEQSVIRCASCGYAQEADEFGFLHIRTGKKELRHVPDWSRLIYERLRGQIENDPGFTLSAGTKIHMIDYDKHKFTEVGKGVITLRRDRFTLAGEINGEKTELTVPTHRIPTLPFSPGKCFELQHGQDIYRCVLDDGRLAMKFINAVKIFYELNNKASSK